MYILDIFLLFLTLNRKLSLGSLQLCRMLQAYDKFATSIVAVCFSFRAAFTSLVRETKTGQKTLFGSRRVKGSLL